MVGLTARCRQPAEEIGMKAEAEKGQHVEGQEFFGQSLLILRKIQYILQAMAEETAQRIVRQGLLVIMKDKPLICQDFIELHVIRSIPAAQKGQEIRKLSRVIRPLEDVFKDLQIGHLFIRKPGRGQYFVRAFRVIAVIVGIIAANARAFEEL